MPSFHQHRRATCVDQRPSPRFTIGRNACGRWVVQDREGRIGGIFISEDAAVHFAAAECDHDPSQIVVCSDGIVLPFAALDDSGANVH
jgi:hypothetical protein